MVFQSHVLYPHMTAYRNMAFPLRLRKAPASEIDGRVRQAAAMLGIEDLLSRKPKELSGGQRQRVAVGRAVVRRPACFLLDEPLSDLDARLRVEMRAELRRLHGRLPTTTIHVTHDQEEAMALGDRLAVVREGRIQQVGPPGQVFRHPANRFVAGFLGARPMNFLEGTLVRQEGRLWFDEGGQRLIVPDWAAGDLADRVDGRVTLGIRPESLRPGPIEGQRHNTLPVKVNLIESLGEGHEVHLSTERHPRIVARTGDYSAFTPGTARDVHVDLDRVHFFEPDDAAAGTPGENLCLAAEERRCRDEP
jgi:multiple sugar transport system ATP-binding protein